MNQPAQELHLGVDQRRRDVVAEVGDEVEGRGADLVSEHVGGDGFQCGLDSLARTAGS
jgi:NADPH:quinone reductase-like Zn-dependent oxidoreductase